MPEDNDDMLSLIKNVAKTAHEITNKQSEISSVANKLRMRRLENHFTADIERLLRGDK